MCRHLARCRHACLRTSARDDDDEDDDRRRRRATGRSSPGVASAMRRDRARVAVGVAVSKENARERSRRQSRRRATVPRAQTNGREGENRGVRTVARGERDVETGVGDVTSGVETFEVVVARRRVEVRLRLGGYSDGETVDVDDAAREGERKRCKRGVSRGWGPRAERHRATVRRARRRRDAASENSSRSRRRRETGGRA